jgi:dihydroflavonol-4-reductase
MRAFLTGGSGFVGGHVARALAARGCEVRCLVRGGRGALEGLDVETVAGDLLDADALRRGMHGCRVVYHCAADYRLFVPDPEAIYAANVDGTRNVLRAAAESGADRVVYTSTVGALGIRGDGSPADETTPVRLADMVGHYKRSKFLAERIADEWVARGLPVVVVNPTAPVGERDVKPTATGKMIVDFLNRRMSAYVDTGLNLVDVRDVAAGHLLAAERGRPGERYILGRENLTLRQIGELLSELTGIPAPRVRLPRWLPLVFAAVDTAVSRAIGREPYVPLDAVRLARHRMFFDASKAVRDLGLPQTPVREALCRAVDWFRRHGHVRRRAA